MIKRVLPNFLPPPETPLSEHHQINTYRVLLTRARQGMVICIPEGNPEDATRLPAFYDGTYHPCPTTKTYQKPEAVFDKLLLMAMTDNQVVFDPMAGSGTTGASAKNGFTAILRNKNCDYISLMEKRLNVKRICVETVKKFVRGKDVENEQAYCTAYKSSQKSDK